MNDRQQEKSLSEKARAYSDEALKTLFDIAVDQDAPPASRLAAANALLDRAYGKAQSAILEEQEIMRPSEIRIVAVAPSFEPSTENSKS